MEVRIVIADPHPVVRNGIRATVGQESDLLIVAEAGTAPEALKAIRRTRPDVVLAELSLACSNELSIAGMIAAEGLAARLLVLSGHCRGIDVYSAITAGAIGYLSKREPLSHICSAIRQAYDGHRVFCEDAQTALQEYLLQQAHSPPPEHAPPAAPLLTDRELEVLRCTAAGVSIPEIGRRLHMSASTVKNHRQSIFAKLCVPNAPAAVYEAIRRGIIA